MMHEAKPKRDHLRNFSFAWKWISPGKSLNTKPSPLAAPKSKRVAGRPRKRALLIGVSYKNQKYELKGTINDVKKMKKWLIVNFEFKGDDILILTEEEPEQKLIPTKRNIQNCMKWLVEDCQAGDSLVFYFSGHGLRQPDFDQDELDGLDEAICPVDFSEQGMISDDEIFYTIVRPLPKDVTLHAIIDACHSGSMLDLTYIYNRDKKDWEINIAQSAPKRETKGGLAISISACRDDQMAADTDAFDLTMSGALTHTLTSIVKKSETITYGHLLDTIYQKIEEADQRGCCATRMLRTLLHQRLLQKPQLSASQTFEVYEKKFIL